MKSQFHLLRYVRPEWRGLAIVLLTMLLGVGVELLKPWPMKLLVDDLLDQRALSPFFSRVLAILPGPDGTGGLLLWICIGTVLIAVTGTLLSMANAVASVGLGQRMTYQLGADLFLHLQRLSLRYHSGRSVGDLSTRIMSDAYCIQTIVLSALVPLLQALVTLVAMFLVMWRLSPTLTVLSLAVVPFLALSIRMFAGPMKKRTRVRRDLEGRMMSVVHQTLHAIPAVQAFTREEAEYGRFRGVAAETVEAYRRSIVASMWFKLSVGLIIAFGTATMMFVGARQVMSGSLTVGSILVFLAYLTALYAPLNSITTTASTWQDAAAYADRVMEVLNSVPEVQDDPAAKEARLRGDIRYEQVSFGYESGRWAVEGVTFEVPAGTAVAIVGPTGAGKTTLLSLLVRFFDPQNGRLFIDGQDIRTLKIQSLRKQIAMVLQDPFIFPLTVAENIGYGRPGATRADIIAAAQAASADEFIARLPDGYETVVGERGATLSGGEKQRLSIARAFLKDAPILILDEPSSALDAATESRLLEALDRLMKGRTTFVIAHRLSTIRNADIILVLDHGRIVEQGRHAELMVRQGLYASLYRQQMDVARHDPAPANESGAARSGEAQ